MDGTADLISSAAIAAHLLSAPLAASLGLGLIATGCGIAQGLHRLKEGHEQGDARLRIKGTGQMAASLGLTLVASGVAVSPGLALITLGASLGVLQRIPRLRPAVDAAVSRADRFLYPVSVKSDATLSTVGRRLHPAAARLGAAAAGVHAAVAPLTGPLEHAVASAGALLMRHAAAVLDRVADSRLAHAADGALGAIEDGLLPEPPASAPEK